jgi:hypothetical protein
MINNADRSGSLNNGAIPVHATVVANKSLISCSLANEAVVLHLEDGIYYGLNPVASRIWELVQQPRTVKEIRNTLLSEYEIAEPACTRDLLELLAQLVRWKLVEVKDGNGSRPLERPRQDRS